MQFSNIITVCLISAILIELTYCAKILCIFVTPYHSHQVVLQALTLELAREGHEIVIMTPKPRKTTIENITEIDVSAVSDIIAKEQYMNKLRRRDEISMGHFPYCSLKFEALRILVDAQLNTPQMLQLIDDETQKFDLIMTEGIHRLGLMITARFQAPVILINSLMGPRENFVSVGAETNFFIYPDYMAQNILFLSSWDKVVGALKYIRMQWLFYSAKHEDDLLINKRFGASAPTITEMLGKVDMLFLSLPRLWDHNRPIAPSVVYMGAIHLKEPEPLPLDLQNCLDSSKNGVIYFSLGSTLSTSDLPMKTIDIILKVFDSLPYDIIMKWEKSYLPNKPNNVRLEKWIPQSDMLRHPKIKVFITQGGLQSTDEAIAANVPLIGLPIAGDQWYNVQMYQKFGIGIQLNIDRLNENEFKDAIMNVAEDERYRANVRRLSRAMADVRERGGLAAAARATRRLAAHGSRYLRAPLADATLVEYYLFDILAIFLSFLIFFVAATVFIIKKICIILFPKRREYFINKFQ